VIANSVAATVTVGNTVTVALDANSLSALENVTVTVGAAVSVSNFPATQVVSGSVAVTTMPALSIGSVTISNFPSTQTIAGTVTANANYEFEAGGPGQPNNAIQIGYYKGSVFEPVTEEDPLPISGTVTANDSGALTIVNSSTVTKANVKFTALAGAYNATDVAQGYTLSLINVDIKGISYVDGQYVNYRNTCVAELVGQGGPAWKAQLIASSVTVSNSVTIGSLPAISGTVTADNPSGALTTRFGSVTTASVAQLTSCVTNTSRKYLLAQNISAGTVTIGIGFSPTTTQGIQLTAGGGLTFDAFCPTGAVYWLGAVTGAAFTILEG
jgi:hypothetical protein